MEIEGLKLDVKMSSEKIREIEQKTKTLENEIIDRSKKLQDHLLRVDCKMLELYLQFRGIPNKQEDVWASNDNINSRICRKTS